MGSGYSPGFICDTCKYATRDEPKMQEHVEQSVTGLDASVGDMFWYYRGKRKVALVTEVLKPNHNHKRLYEMEVYELVGDPLVTEEDTAQKIILNERRPASYGLLSELADEEVTGVVEAFERKQTRDAPFEDLGDNYSTLDWLLHWHPDLKLSRGILDKKEKQVVKK